MWYTNNGLTGVNLSVSIQEELSLMTVEETFDMLQSRFNPGAAAGLNKTIQLDLSGEDAGKWALKIANQTCELIPGGVEKPDLTLTMSDQDWLDLVARKLDPMQAFMIGRIKYSGDIMLAQRMIALFRLNG
jgi:putative sterol carrier protein